MEAGGQPRPPPGFCAGQVDPCHADLGESERTRPLTQSSHQLLPVEVIPPLHAPILGTRLLHWPDESHCAGFAAALARSPALHDAFIELHGPLGAGKTTFVRHLLRALGVSGRIKSPSYAVLEPHQAGALSVSHFDFYRFKDPREWADAGFREIFAAPGLKLAEWPEHAAGQLPVPDLRLLIEPQPDESRRVRAEALTERGSALLAAC